MTSFEVTAGGDPLSNIPSEEVYATVVSAGVQLSAENGDLPEYVLSDQVPRFIKGLGRFAPQVTCVITFVEGQPVVHVRPKED